MYGPSYYKLDARRLLSGGYGRAVLGAAILVIPSYVLSLLEQLLFAEVNGAARFIGTAVIELIFTVFVINILQVGYYRFLMSYENADPTGERQRKPDLNAVVSGFSDKYGRTLKVMLARDIYMLGWLLVGLTPLLLFLGFMIFTIQTTEVMANVYNMFMQAALSPTADMISNLSDYILANCPYLPIIMTLTFFLSVAAFIPYIMKMFEYAAIPMIAADHPDMDVKHAFARTKDIMTGFKLRYFLIQLSFIGYALLLCVIVSFIPSAAIMIIGLLMLDPYISMTNTRFYRERNTSIEYNISFYGPHMP